MQKASPLHITFTGADDKTDPRQLADLCMEHPIELGILFSPKLTGTPRYPSPQWISTLFAKVQAPLAAHICGAYSRELLETGTIRDLVPVLATGRFKRVQINTAEPRVLDRMALITAWADALKVQVILQSRNASAFPAPGKAQWLFDASGGRGLQPKQWPAEPSDRLVGYAGGLNPGNVRAAVEDIGGKARRYWIDMESGVRDASNSFSVDMCRKVCQKVYRPC